MEVWRKIESITYIGTKNNQILIVCLSIMRINKAKHLKLYQVKFQRESVNNDTFNNYWNIIKIESKLGNTKLLIDEYRLYKF